MRGIAELLSMEIHFHIALQLGGFLLVGLRAFISPGFGIILESANRHILAFLNARFSDFTWRFSMLLFLVHHSKGI